jgi:hypothetical protein
MKAIRTEAQLTSFRSRSDRSVGFSGVTPEMSSQEKCALFDLQNVLVEMLVYPKDVKDAEVVDVGKEIDGKSATQRQRGVIFLIWKRRGEEGAFEAYYALRMEQNIEKLKSELEGL